MADVFISYARQDRARAEQLASSIEAEGWTVWWDRRIQVGKSFSSVIEAELDAAQCVLVLWSPSSVESEWVLTEAAEGARRKILVPVSVQDVRIPLEFRRLQTANLMQWRPGVWNAEFDACIAAIGSRVQPSATVQAQTPKTPRSPKPPAANLASPVQSSESGAARPPNSRRKWPPSLTKWPPSLTKWPPSLTKWLPILAKSLPIRTVWFVAVVATVLFSLLGFARLDGWLDRVLGNEKAATHITNTATVKTATTTSSMPVADPAPSGVDLRTSAGILPFELTSKEPEQVDRFVALLRRRAYHGAYFRRSPNGVVVLGLPDSEDPRSAGMSHQPHERGTLSIPLRNPYRNSKTLMFICLSDSPPPSLNEEFVVIGRMEPGSPGIDVAERIARGNRDVVIQSVRFR